VRAKAEHLKAVGASNVDPAYSLWVYDTGIEIRRRDREPFRGGRPKRPREKGERTKNKRKGGTSMTKR